MSFTEVIKKWSGTTATAGNDARTAREIYQVLSDDAANDTAPGAIAAVGIPRGAAYPSDPFMTAQTITASQQTPTFYEVTVDYSTGPSSPLPSEPENPLDEPPDISFESEVTQEEVPSGFNDSNVLVPVVNAVGDPFDPPPQQETSTLIYRVTRNQADFDVALILPYTNAINNDSFLGAAPGQAKMRRINAVYFLNPTQPYWRVSYEIAFREGLATVGGDATTGPAKAWWLRILNTGLECLKSAIKVKAVDSNGRPVSAPVRLNADGTQVSPTDTTTRSYVAFRPQFSKLQDFAPLNLEY
jgi:hypothetical protein